MACLSPVRPQCVLSLPAGTVWVGIAMTHLVPLPVAVPGHSLGPPPPPPRPPDQVKTVAVETTAPVPSGVVFISLLVASI